MITRRAKTPAATVTAFAGSVAPAGWLECNGAAVSRATYAALFAVIGTTYGAGNGTTTFNLPDLRGEFVRGWDHGRGVDAGRALGSSQAEEVGPHEHELSLEGTSGGDIGTGTVDRRNDSGSTGAATMSADNKALENTGTENRPRNVALMYIIKV